jgi:hypothetical protein
VKGIQDWISANIKKDTQQIFITEAETKGEILTGDAIIIKDYPNLNNIYIKLDQVKIITIENSEKLESIETIANEINLKGNFSKLKSIKTDQKSQQQPTIIKKEPILCWKCISIVAFFILAFTLFYLYVNKRFKQMKDYHDKHCRGKK